ncbi:helix-turn-helix domain-containing protein [Flammeovirga aprica]|uniref:Helix-turn-helix domain-containing protein n=1 Tax=Flammeovirga aprica JL-4 TaxID=694437 RepID=A0A7X9RXM0_9BACT|nr:helix-turn-helix domain-containing protein [Flammeovirga aprica]NME70552.1 helix-turn-helix domain-containing protein [Flammeovirga aprica JL-4]
MISFDPQLLVQLDQDETFVLLHLCKRIGKSKTAYPSNDLLKEDTGMGINKIKRVIASLQEKEMITASQTMLEKGKFGPRIIKVLTPFVRVYNTPMAERNITSVPQTHRSADSVSTVAVPTETALVSKEVISPSNSTSRNKLKEEERTHSKFNNQFDNSFDKEKIMNRCMELQKQYNIEGELDEEKIQQLCEEKLTLTDSFLVSGMQHFGFKYFKPKQRSVSNSSEVSDQQTESKAEDKPANSKKTIPSPLKMDVDSFTRKKSGKVIGEWLNSISHQAQQNTIGLLQSYLQMLQDSNLCSSLKHLENTLYKTFDTLLKKMNNTKNMGCLNKALREAVRQREPYLDQLI